MSTSGGPGGDDGGLISVQYVAAIGLSLLLVTVLANLIVFQYGRGVVRAALDEGVRTGSRATASTSECEARARDVVDDLLGGRMGREITVACGEDGELVVAEATAVFRGWLPAVPDWAFTVRSVAVREGTG